MGSMAPRRSPKQPLTVEQAFGRVLRRLREQQGLSQELLR
jgi:ribosome-binding protein aMBF1 (putative translation factor)